MYRLKVRVQALAKCQTDVRIDKAVIVCAFRRLDNLFDLILFELILYLSCSNLLLGEKTKLILRFFLIYRMHWN